MQEIPAFALPVEGVVVVVAGAVVPDVFPGVVTVVASTVDVVFVLNISDIVPFILYSFNVSLLKEKYPTFYLSFLLYIRKRLYTYSYVKFSN